MISLNVAVTTAAIFVIAQFLVSLITSDRYMQLVIWVAYYALSEILESRDMMHAPSWRASRFARFVRRFTRVQFHQSQVQRIAELLGSDECTIWMIGPHGMGCFGMIFGFAAPGSDERESGITEKNLARLRVVAHPIYKFIPILRNIYAAFGVIGGKSAVKAALERKDSLVVTPCGFMGKYFSLLHGPSGLSPDFWYSWQNPRTRQVETVMARGQPDIFDDCTLVLKTENLAIFAMAKRYNARLVNVLSPEEDHTYLRTHLSSKFAAYTVTLGPWLFGQKLPVLEFYVGRAYYPDYSRRTLEEIRDEVARAFVEIGYAHRRQVVTVGRLASLNEKLITDNLLVSANFLISLAVMLWYFGLF
jgi:hypothetical protein